MLHKPKGRLKLKGFGWGCKGRRLQGYWGLSKPKTAEQLRPYIPKAYNQLDRKDYGVG